MVGRQDAAAVDNMAAWLGSRAVDMAVGMVADMVAYKAVGKAAYMAVGKAAGTVADSSRAGDREPSGVVLPAACMVVAGAWVVPQRVAVVEASVVPPRAAAAGALVVLLQAAGLAVEVHYKHQLDKGKEEVDF